MTCPTCKKVVREGSELLRLIKTGKRWQTAFLHRKCGLETKLTETDAAILIIHKDGRS